MIWNKQYPESHKLSSIVAFGTPARHNDWSVIFLSSLWRIVASSMFHVSKCPFNRAPFAPFGILLRSAKKKRKEKRLLQSTLLGTTGQRWPCGFWPLGLKCPQNHLIPHSPMRFTEISSCSGVRLCCKSFPHSRVKVSRRLSDGHYLDNAHHHIPSRRKGSLRKITEMVYFVWLPSKSQMSQSQILFSEKQTN